MFSTDKAETAYGKTVYRMYLIVGLFVAIIIILVVLFNLQMDASVAIRVYVGGEGLWAKAQKDAILSLEHYAVSHDEADYQNFLRLIQVPLGDQRTRMELQKTDPDLDVARKGYLQGRNHPVDIEYAIPFFRRFQHTAYMSRVIEHWTKADQQITELTEAAEALHEEITSGHSALGALRSLHTRLEVINRKVTEEEDLFSSTLAEASRWANDVSRKLTYSIALLFAALGLVLSWPIVTRIRTAETALRQSEEKYRNICENANDMIFTMSKDGVFISLNASFKRMTGWPIEEWIGKSFAPLIHPDDLQKSFEMFQRVLSGESLASFELRFLTKSSGYSIGEYTGAPIRQGDSTIVLGIMRDVTERKKMEESLREFEQRFRIIFDNANDGILLADVEKKKFSLGNKMICLMLGYGPEEIQTLGVADIHPEKDLPHVIDQFERQQKQEIAVAENLPVKRKDGTVFYADVSSSPVTLGGKTYLVGIFRDITERKKIEEEIRLLNVELEQKVKDRTRELLEAQKELIRKEKLATLGQIAGSVGHELRNPLGVMNNAVYYLQTVLSEADETVREYLNIIKSEISGAEHIVSDLLDAVRTKQPHTQLVSAEEVIRMSLEKCRIPENITLDIQAETQRPVSIDPLQMKQVFINLTNNAVDAMPEGGVLRVAARQVLSSESGALCSETQKKNSKLRTQNSELHEDFVEISVSDTGCGISPENMQKIFQPLFTTKARGIGLGLVVVKNLTEANGGIVSVESEIGKGTVFTVTLPATED